MSVTPNSTIATATSMAGTNHKLVRRTSLRQCEASADDGTPRYMFGILPSSQGMYLTGGFSALLEHPRPPGGPVHSARLSFGSSLSLGAATVTARRQAPPSRRHLWRSPAPWPA